MPKINTLFDAVTQRTTIPKHDLILDGDSFDKILHKENGILNKGDNSHTAQHPESKPTQSQKDECTAQQRNVKDNAQNVEEYDDIVIQPQIEELISLQHVLDLQTHEEIDGDLTSEEVREVQNDLNIIDINVIDEQILNTDDTSMSQETNIVDITKIPVESVYSMLNIVQDIQEQNTNISDTSCKQTDVVLIVNHEIVNITTIPQSQQTGKNDNIKQNSDYKSMKHSIINPFASGAKPVNDLAVKNARQGAKQTQNDSLDHRILTQVNDIDNAASESLLTKQDITIANNIEQPTRLDSQFIQLRDTGQAVNTAVSNNNDVTIRNVENISAHDQIIMSIKSAIDNKHSEITLRMYPEELGIVNITIEFSEVAKINTIKIVAEDLRTLNMLQEDYKKLEFELQKVVTIEDDSHLSFDLQQHSQGDNKQERASNGDTSKNITFILQQSQNSEPKIQMRSTVYVSNHNGIINLQI